MNEEQFEFERKFLVRDPGVVAGTRGDLLIQGYLFISDGYSVRVRLKVDSPSDDSEFFSDQDPRELVIRSPRLYSTATLTVKSPPIAGIRYEAEMSLDVDVAINLCHASLGCIAKSRYPLVCGDDLWTIDVFHGKNAPLVIAECERSQPVVDLDVPSFCGDEITDSPEFSNESLALLPLQCRTRSDELT